MSVNGQVAQRLLEKEKLEKQDLVELIGARPFAEQTTYEQFLQGAGEKLEEAELPPGLRDWNREDKDKDTKEEKSDKHSEKPAHKTDEKAADKPVEKKILKEKA